MQIPNSLQDTWKKVTQDKTVSVDDYKELVKAAAPNGNDEELDDNEAQFLSKLNSELKTNDIITKGSVPIGVLSFGEAAKTAEQPAKVQATQPQPEAVETDEEGVDEEVAQPQSTPTPAQKTTPVLSGQGLGEANYTLNIPDPDLPRAPVLLNWPGYNKQVNTAFSTAFGEKPKAGGQVPVLSKAQADNIINTFGAGSIKQFQQAVGAKQDNQFGPETYFRAKTNVASQINETGEIEKLTKLRSLIGVLGNDPEVGQMREVLDKRIGAVTNFLNTRNEGQNYFNQVNSIIGHANPENMESLVGAKTSLQSEFSKLSDNTRALPQIADVNSQAIGRVDSAISTLQTKLDAQDIINQKNQLVSQLNGVLDKAVMGALTTGDTAKLQEGKTQIDATIEKFPKVKNEKDIQAVKQQAYQTLDDVGAKINSINSLIAKKDWTSAESASAVKMLGELPDGALKTKLNNAITAHSEAAKLREKERSQLPTTEKGLHDVIGNGVFNLENPEGTKGMFQLIAKQGLLPEAVTKMSVNDQTEAIKILTKDVKFDKQNDADKFNVGIAKLMYDNLSKSANVDKDIKNKTLPHLQKETTPQNFDNHNIDLNTFVKGMKFSIGDDRLGSEQEAALTMTRGIMNGEVPKQALGQLNRYELNDLTKFVEKKGSKEEKAVFLNTVSKAYTEGVAVNVESLDRGDKAKVIKGILDMPKPDESKLNELMKKSGKKTVYDLVKNEKLSDSQLAMIAKHTDGNEMADEPDVAAKLLTSMIKTYSSGDSSVSIDSIRKYIDQIDNNHSIFQSHNQDTMKKVISALGDGKDSDYAKFQALAPSTLDKIWKISD